ncbi:MAG: sugar ABC transporter ATP-binding protein [Solirubrobacterales bacterium]
MSLLEARGIDKSYPGVRALAGVDLSVDPGEIHALLGQNGAGKSTLMKVIAGTVEPDGGTIAVDGEPIELGSPEAAAEHGIGLVYQETSLVGPLSVSENVLLGRWPMRRGQVDWGALRARAQVHLDRVGFDVDPKTEIRELGMAERQLVELAKALSLGVRRSEAKPSRAAVEAPGMRVMLLDEPTSALSDRETQRLFEICRALRDQGVAIVYVSHRLAEIVEICDRVTVLRDGERVKMMPAEGVQESQLARLMVGGERMPAEAAEHSAVAEDAADVALRVRGLARPPRLRPCDLAVRSGEIVAVFGLVGAGRTRLARTLFGLEPAEVGTIEVFGSERRIATPIDAIAAGLGYLGEDRVAGLVPQLSVAANITLASLGRTTRAGVLDFKRERAVAERSIAELGIRVSSPDQLAGTLSGGNQQKVVIARWITSGARILILDDPTRGVDVGAKAEVFRLIAELADDGVAVLFFTSEITEARALGDRILVMADGSVVSEMPAEVADEEIMTAAGGAYA